MFYTSTIIICMDNLHSIRIKIFLFIFLFLTALSTLFVSPVVASNWYLDNSATGNNSGTSWANAWKDASNINFSVIASGDTLYISGGNISKTYTGMISIPSGTSGITISGSNESGHNGEIIFNGAGATSSGIRINGTGKIVKDLTISDITFNAYTEAGIYGNGQTSGGMQNITINSCKFTNFKRSGVFMEGNGNLNNNFNIVVKNSHFDDDNNFTGQSDGIYVQVLKDFTADNNTIILDNNYLGVTDLHSDNIQSFWVDNVTYSNNVVKQSNSKTLGTQMLFTENGYGTHILFNNVFIRDTPNAEDSAIRLKSTEGLTYTAKVIGNTYYGKGRILNSSVISEIKNNIFYGLSQPTTSRPLYITATGSDVSNNIFYDPDSQFPATDGGVETNPVFRNLDFNNTDLRLANNSPAIDAG